MDGDKRLLITISILSLIELIIFLCIDYFKYKGIIALLPFIVLLVFQPFWYLIIKKSRNLYRKVGVKLRFILLYSLIIPLLFYIALPSYSYSKAQELLSTEYGEEVKFIDLPREQETIAANNKVGFLLDKKIYFFSIEVEDGKIIDYTVNPKSGKITEIKE